MYDIVVIGCGPGGYAAAIRARQLGGKVAVIEAGDLGGVCVNRGCIPSKVWLEAAELANRFRRAEAFGFKGQTTTLDPKVLVDRKNEVGANIRLGMEALLGKNGAELIKGQAKVLGPGKVQVNGNVLETKKIILSTGSALDIPNIPGLAEALLTSDQALDLTQLPKSILIYGRSAGPVQVEFAYLYRSLGLEVVLATPQSRILEREDSETSQRLTQALREQGVIVMIRTTLVEVKKKDGGFAAQFSAGEPMVTEKVLIADRKANTTGLGLESLKLKHNDDGSLWVDDRLRTSSPNIYAIGDLTGGWANSHAASAMGVTAAENALGQDKKFPFHLIPRVMWTGPAVGTVGLSEEEADEKGFNVETGSFPFSINGLAMCTGEVDGAVKIVWDGASQEILGVHIVGAGATEVIGEAVLALQLECTIDELAHTIRPHPTMAEAVMDAGRDAAKWALYLPPR